MQYVPKKPDMYGLKIFWACDSKIAYPVRCIPYLGKEKRGPRPKRAIWLGETTCWAIKGFQSKLSLIAWSHLGSIILIQHPHHQCDQQGTQWSYCSQNHGSCTNATSHLADPVVQTLVLSVIHYGFCLLTLSAAQLQRLIPNEDIGSILGCTRHTSVKAMRYLLDLLPMPDCHMVAQVKAFGQVSADLSNQPHNKFGQPVNCRLRRGTSWLTRASREPSRHPLQTKLWYIGHEKPGASSKLYTCHLDTLQRMQRMSAGSCSYRSGVPHCHDDDDCVIFTDGSVANGTK